MILYDAICDYEEATNTTIIVTRTKDDLYRVEEIFRGVKQSCTGTKEQIITILVDAVNHVWEEK